VTPISLGIFASANTTVNTSFESIATVSVGSGGSSTVTFSSIPATYAHLQIRMMVQTNRSVGVGDDIGMTFNGSSTDYYGYHILYGNGSSAAATDNNITSYIDLSRFSTQSVATDIFSAGIVDILDYTSTNKNKTTRVLAGYDGNGSGIINFGSGLWKPATPVAITSITLVPLVGTSFNQYSHFALYGIKSA
jgi:hypothetical protein